MRVTTAAPGPRSEVGEGMLVQRTLRLSLAALASGISLFLSWPYWRDFQYWPESRPMWLIYFLLGFVLAVYVFYAFLVSLRTLFEHDALERASRLDRLGSSAASQEDAP